MLLIGYKYCIFHVELFHYLAGIHFALQETSTEHPFGNGTTIHGWAFTLSLFYQRDFCLLKCRRNIS